MVPRSCAFHSCFPWLLGAVLALLGATGSTLAGELDRADIARRFPPPLRVGEKLRDVPAWPLTSELEPEAGPVAYAFESIDLAPIPGFEGTPLNLLVTVDRKGSFMDVEVLRQHEPVFLSGLGEAPLRDFVRQYSGRNLRQNISVASAYGETRGGDGNRVVLDGVAKATASVRIVNQTVLAAALAVARARLGFAPPAKGGAALVRPEVFGRLAWAELLRRGHVARLALTNREVEALFAGSEGAGVDAEALARPGETFLEVYVAYLNAPTIGRSLLGDTDWARAMVRAQDGQHLFWIATAGRDALVDERFVPGTTPPRLALSQGGLPLELRDAVADLPSPAGVPALNAARVFRVPAAAGLDPGKPLRFEYTLERARGQILPVVSRVQASFDYQPPAELFVYPPEPLPEWLLAWAGRWPELTVISVALALLSALLARPRWLAVSARRLLWFRTGFAVFTLVFIGWWAQGQLSIVHLTGAVKALAAGQGLGSYLYDPVSLLLIAFTGVSFFVWGRGTFCGWLCPFGALQELVALLARALRLPQWRLPGPWAQALARGRYVLLAALLAAAGLAPAWAERMVEIEPFKTAITVGFDRSWPYVAWAVAMLVAGALSYKFFCRYLCPLGAAMALGGRLRRWNWLPRRAECGQPCQTCRHRCAYDAIATDGAIRYEACFQCLDCVGIYHDPQRCAPVLLYRRKGRRVAAGRDGG